MNLHIKRQFKVCVLTAAVIGGLTTTSQAGIIPWLYDAVFGPPGSMLHTTSYGYGAAYRGYYSPYAQGAGYGYAPTAGAGCNSCATTSTTYYGPTTTSYVTNDCSIPSAAPTTTHRNPPPAGNGPEPEKTLMDDPMDEDDGFRQNTRGDGTDVPPASTKSFKIPENGDVVPQRPKAGQDDAVEEEKTDEPQVEQLRVPALHLDTAMTTHPVVMHRRTEWHARFATPTIARKTRAINADWIPVSSQRRIAGK